MRAVLMGRDLPIIEALLRQEGIEIVTEDPDVIITHGGDGFLLDAERNYPGIPKLPIRRNSICKTCVDHDTTHIIKALARDTISQSKVMKLTSIVNDKAYHALNEFSLHHIKPNQAIRFKVQINAEAHVDTAIGDGLVVSTPFGSHAYYRSITNSTFRQGIGLAFNNTTESIDHTVVRESDTITITILRGPAYFLVDNDPNHTVLEEGAVVTIAQSPEPAVLIGLEYAHCPDCGVLESTVAEAAL